MNISELQKMSLDELRALRMVIDKFIDTKAIKVAGELKVGDYVKINHKKVAGMTFAVIKINRKKIKVKKIDSNTTYTVSMTLIEKI